MDSSRSFPHYDEMSGLTRQGGRVTQAVIQ
jgi:hypothetical protein